MKRSGVIKPTFCMKTPYYKPYVRKESLLLSLIYKLRLILMNHYKYKFSLSSTVTCEATCIVKLVFHLMLDSYTWKNLRRYVFFSFDFFSLILYPLYRRPCKVLRHYIPHCIFEILRVKWQNWTPRFILLPQQANVNIELIIHSLSGIQTSYVHIYK